MYIEKNIEKTVNRLIKKNKTSNPEELIRSMKNVDFAYEPLTENLHGYYFYISEKRQIVRVDEFLNYFSKQYVLFHELAHIISKHRGTILFDCLNTVSNLKEEYEADLIATYMFVRHNEITASNVDDFVLPKRASELVHKFILDTGNQHKNFK
ncbi:ImmA/IrrE family metallo-endopeptidase [Clostridium sp.]|uniref:ImmA/IrrE family metallo-endopeptidase n=1 Tax=Clostridium sp. TaxID=1506 RepID=UPI002FC7ECB8